MEDQVYCFHCNYPIPKWEMVKLNNKPIHISCLSYWAAAKAVLDNAKDDAKGKKDSSGLVQET